MMIQSTKRDSTVGTIVSAATQVWAADPSATLDQIASAAGVGRATLHRHFPGGRRDLLRAAAVAGIMALQDALEPALDPGLTPDVALVRLLDVLVRSGDRLHFLLVADLADDVETTAAETEVNDRIHVVLDRAVAAGLLRSDVARVWRFRALEALVYAAWTSVAAGEIAPLDAPSFVDDVFRRGFGA